MVYGRCAHLTKNICIISFCAKPTQAFVTWVDLLPATEIRFTDHGWACGGFRESPETDLIFTVPSDTAISAGSVFAYEDDMDTTGTPWTLATGTFSLTGDPGDQIIVYQGTLSNPTPIFAFDTNGGWETDCSAVTSYTSTLPDGLEDGVSAVSFDHSDSFWYRPWYSRSATLATLKEWMVNRSRFKTTSTSATRVADYSPPLDGFTILDGQRGTNGYVEYIPGTAPCIILSGHDGDLYPSEIDDRTHGCWDAPSSTCDWSKTCSPQDSSNCRAVTANDENTQDMARRANDEFGSFTGERCHLIVNRLGRIKLDPNREVLQAVQFDPIANVTYHEFHDFTTHARQDIENNHPCGAGLLIDFHGHTHPEARIELGYKISATQLREPDTTLDTLAYTSSIKNMPSESRLDSCLPFAYPSMRCFLLQSFCNFRSHSILCCLPSGYSLSACTYKIAHNGVSFSEVIRGATSMGAFFELPTAQNVSGYLSVPSPQVNAPASGEDYFQGGYNVETHGSQDGGTIDAIQIEFPRYLRAQLFDQQADVLKAFGTTVLPKILQEHYPAACDFWSQPTGCTSDLDCDQSLFCSPQVCDSALGCQTVSDPCLPSEFCLEDSDACVQCQEHSDCDDNNGCTINRCLGDGTCDFTESACLPGEVCNESSKLCEAAGDGTCSSNSANAEAPCSTDGDCGECGAAGRRSLSIHSARRLECLGQSCGRNSPCCDGYDCVKVKGSSTCQPGATTAPVASPSDRPSLRPSVTPPEFCGCILPTSMPTAFPTVQPVASVVCSTYSKSRGDCEGNGCSCTNAKGKCGTCE